MNKAQQLLKDAEEIEGGTYGPKAMERFQKFGTPLPPLKFKRLGKCDTDHLQAIQRHVNSWTHGWLATLSIQLAVALILEDRRQIIRLH